MNYGFISFSALIQELLFQLDLSVRPFDGCVTAQALHVCDQCIDLVGLGDTTLEILISSNLIQALWA